MAQQKYRFNTEFNDFGDRRNIEMTQPATTHRDVEYFRFLISRLKHRAPEFAQYIIDTAELIVEAGRRISNGTNSE